MNLLLIKTFVWLNRLLDGLWLGAPSVERDEVTWENVKFMLNYLWEKYVTQFWVRWAEWTKLWEKYGGWWVVIPIVLIIAYIKIRHHHLAPDVDRLTEKRDVKGLIRALEFKRQFTIDKITTDEVYDDCQAVRIRCSAAAALGNLCDKRGVEPLLEAMCDPDKYVRVNVVRALSNYGHKEVKAAV